MKSRIFVLMSTITVFAGLIIRIRVAGAAQPHRYSVINLGGPFAAFGINNQGWAIGDGELPGDQTEHGFLRRTVSWEERVDGEAAAGGGSVDDASGFAHGAPG